MWLLIAVICYGTTANTCESMVWQEKSFLTIESCTERVNLATSMLPPDVKYYNARCIQVPSQANT